MKRALITGITGQDGSYLVELLLEKNYEVCGVVRRASTFNRWRIDHIHKNLYQRNKNFHLEYGDLNDSSSLIHILQKVKPDEIYNLAAQSHVQVSFETPEYTGNIDALGVLRMIEAIRILGLEKTCKLYQASTSELYGNVQEYPQNEETQFHPASPYGVAKLYAFWIIKTYREAYNMFAVNGILFNHESPRRGENFVSKKITQSLARVKLGVLDKLVLGNLDAKRDWGYAKEYVEAMWMMLQQKKAEDFAIGTGHTYTVREFVEHACECYDINLEWIGSGRNEKGIDKKSGKIIVELDERYLRPTEVHLLQADITKAKEKLGWVPKTSFKELVKMMCDFDFKQAQKGESILID